MRTSYFKHVGIFLTNLQLLVRDPGVDSSLKTLLICVGRYEIKPHVYEKLVEKTMYMY